MEREGGYNINMNTCISLPQKSHAEKNLQLIKNVQASLDIMQNMKMLRTHSIYEYMQDLAVKGLCRS